MDELVHVRVGAGAPPASLLLQMVVAGWCRGGISHLTVVTVSLLKLTQREAAPPGPAQAGFFEAPPGPVHAGSPPEVKLAFFGALFAARTDIYAARWDNARTGQKGWLPAVRGGWRKGIRHAERDYLPLTAEVLAAHLSGQMHIGLYPLLDGDRCSWLAADFDGTAAMLDALNYIKAARALGVPAGLEVSRSGTGAHVWIFFTAPVPAEAARRLGTGLLREAMSLRGQMSLASYDRLFPSQGTLPAAGVGNLIAAPLYGKSRRDGATVFLDTATMEPYEDQWAYHCRDPRLPRPAHARARRIARQTRTRLHQPRLPRPPPPPAHPQRLAKQCACKRLTSAGSSAGEDQPLWPMAAGRGAEGRRGPLDRAHVGTSTADPKLRRLES